jgi:penicillin G amidase
MRGTWMAPRRINGYALYRASSVAEARELFRGYPGVSENRLFADVNGSIGWQLVGDVPVRKKGHGLLPMPGWDLDAGWEDEPLPFEEMPHKVDPPEGFLATANAAPPEPTRRYLGVDWLDAGRHNRVHSLLAPRSDWDVAATMAMQLDRTNVYWAALREPFVQALTPPPPGTEEAAKLLQAWDGVVGAESAGAAVFELLFAELMVRATRAKAPKAWLQSVGEGLNGVIEHGIMGLRRSSHLVRLVVEQPAGWFASGWREEIRNALTAAVEQLQRKAGRDTKYWQWGKVRTLTLMHPVGKLPVLKGIFNVGPMPFGGDGSTIPQASTPFEDPLGNPIGIPNLRMVLDVGNWEASRWVIAGGQSGNPLSPHYADQIPLWQRGEGIAIAWEPASVRAAARATLQLTPG